MRALSPLLLVAVLLACVGGQVEPDEEEIVEVDATVISVDNTTVPPPEAPKPEPGRRDFLKLGAGLGLGVAAGSFLNPSQIMEFSGRAGDSYELQLAQVQGGAYAEIDVGENGGVIVLVDTGAALSYMSGKAASRLGNDKGSTDQDRSFWFGAKDNTGALHRPNVMSLTSRTNSGLSVRLPVAPADRIMPGGFDGVWGIDQLQRFAAVEFDWASGKLRLYREPYDYSKETEPMFSFSVDFRPALEALGSTLPFAKASFGKGASAIEVDVLVDTGAPATVVTPQVAQLAHMKAVDEYTLVGEASQWERYFNYEGPLLVAGVVRVGKRHPGKGQSLGGSAPTMRLSYALVGLDPKCGGGAGDASNSCGLHIHAGTSCDENALGHLHHKSKDPWKVASYVTTRGEATGDALLTAGLDDTEVIGRALIAHAYDGSRLACAIIEAAGPPDGLLQYESEAITLGRMGRDARGDANEQCHVKHEQMPVYVGETKRMKVVPYSKDSFDERKHGLLGLDLLRPHKHKNPGHGSHTGPQMNGRFVLDMRQGRGVILGGKNPNET